MAEVGSLSFKETLSIQSGFGINLKYEIGQPTISHKSLPIYADEGPSLSTVTVN